jgi:hypothetical protein
VSITSATPAPRQEWIEEVEGSEILRILLAEPADEARILDRPT